MPGGDRTGPMGAGPMTGRGAGYCAGNDAPGYATPGFGRGFWGRGFGRGGGRGFGRGGGRGWRNGFWATGLPGWIRFGWGMFGGETAASEEDALRNEADALQQHLDAIRQRLDALKGNNK